MFDILLFALLRHGKLVKGERVGDDLESKQKNVVEADSVQVLHIGHTCKRTGSARKRSRTVS